jgi:hypothetical protein
MAKGREEDADDGRDAAEPEYRIVTAGSVEELERKVNRLIEKGWRVQGGVATVSVGFMCFQAMVR